MWKRARNEREHMAWLKEGYEMGCMVLKTNMFPMPI
jgi:hypothetical protein